MHHLHDWIMSIDMKIMYNFFWFHFKMHQVFVAFLNFSKIWYFFPYRMSPENLDPKNRQTYIMNHQIRFRFINLDFDSNYYFGLRILRDFSFLASISYQLMFVKVKFCIFLKLRTALQLTFFDTLNRINLTLKLKNSYIRSCFRLVNFFSRLWLKLWIE
jgi:hypothetical protein